MTNKCSNQNKCSAKCASLLFWASGFGIYISGKFSCLSISNSGTFPYFSIYGNAS